MKINTKYFGEIEIDKTEIITFPDGIIAFPDETAYILIGQLNLDSPFQFLQSVNNPELCFIVTAPFFFCKEYTADLDDTTVAELAIQDQSQVAFYVITVVPEDIKQMRANLRAPLVINTQNKRAKQVVLNNDKYRVKHYLYQEVPEPGQEEAAVTCSY